MKAKKRFTIPDIYKMGKAQKRVSYKDYKKIFTMYAERVMDNLIEKGESFTIPKRLGIIQVRKVIAKNRAIDFKRTRDFGMIIYHNNNHSGGYSAFFLWDKSLPQGHFLNKALWKYVGTRQVKRKLARYIKEHNSINLYLNK